MGYLPLMHDKSLFRHIIAFDMWGRVKYIDLKLCYMFVL